MAWLKKLQAVYKAPNLLFRGTFSYDFDGIPLVAKNISIQKRINLLKCGLDMLLHRKRLMCLPPSIQVEPTNICNLDCPLCPTGSTLIKRPKGEISMNLFNRLLEELGDVLLTIILYSWGEPFLSKHFPEMVESCTRRNILTLTSTNGNCSLTKDDALRIVDAGLSALVIAMDGSTQDIYQTYRRGGDIEKVKRFASIIQEAKAIRGSKLPYTNLRVVINNSNEKDLDNIKHFARDLKMDQFSIKSIGDLTANTPFDKFETTDTDMRRYVYGENEGKRKKKPEIKCPFPFRQPTVFWDGTVVGCEFDYETTNSWGKIGDRPFTEIWNSVSALRHRTAILNRKHRPIFCSSCPYRDRVQKSSIVYSVKI